MKSEDPAAMMNSLLGLKKNGGEVEDGNSRRLVKVCGITRPQDAEIALQNGANFIG